MALKGGYKIVDFQGVILSNSNAVNVDGVFESMSDSYGKIIHIENFNIDGLDFITQSYQVFVQKISPTQFGCVLTVIDSSGNAVNCKMYVNSNNMVTIDVPEPDGIYLQYPTGTFKPSVDSWAKEVNLYQAMINAGTKPIYIYDFPTSYKTITQPLKFIISKNEDTGVYAMSTIFNVPTGRMNFFGIFCSSNESYSTVTGGL